ncbi:arrestin domain-containing protein 3-like [Strongylocentrotus purpuratus]|uniref:Arrestin-like N-terminal domain-containing protein n=1 Tax=Strongylocentrotus purpuratus TaxID=7668 RepID=A0A7M7SU40_STRPU|nr:arrestin domain-containing protein 3-like [Strongylocentrotus purpuratus]
MGKLKVFEVLLTGNQEVYKPGDVVQGEARIVVSEEKGDIRDIRVKCVGKSFTWWSKREWLGWGLATREVTYYTKHEYFREEITLQGAGNDNSAANRITLTAGEHRFPFQFEIPNTTLPPPFEDPFGHVRYYVKGTIGRPWKIDHRTQKLFSIVTVKDLNYELNVLTILRKRFIGKRGYVKVFGINAFAVPYEFLLVTKLRRQCVASAVLQDPPFSEGTH